MKFTKEAVLEKCIGFVDAQVWPLTHQLNPIAWLSNFSENETDYALCLLNSFVYYSEAMVNKMLRAAYQDLLIAEFGHAGTQATAILSHFDKRMCITHVTGELPNATDSGHLFARKARQVLGVPESKILYPQQAIAKLACHDVDYIIFVDDFLGSGKQFSNTWTRPYNVGMDLSFELFSERSGAKFYYIPLVATEDGIENLNELCPHVKICSANVLPSRYSVFDQNTIIWPEYLKDGASNFVKTASERAGYGNGEGFAGFGFQIAFSHGVPDATLPLFWSEENGWKPLIRRS
ncbi:hypothetical protein [Azospirillum sp. TSH64]|uniref:phosphoribosyltransferase-like protein n=1 Tax=Azospirillum sp. TSH64 TaxID=652740 RepID=UPI0011B261F3|nr:hypothetical protein [Azospirillum sp. TSH64]